MMKRVFLCLLSTFTLGWIAMHAAADATVICDGAPNSVGPGAALRWAGAYAPEGGQLRVSGLPPSQPGWMLYGLYTDDVPFGNGQLCIGGAKWIMARTTSDVQGRVRLDIESQAEEEDFRWLHYYGTWYMQYLYRDPLAGGAAFNLSDALQVSWE